MNAVTSSASALADARRKLYSIAGGSYDSGNVRLSRISTQQRIAYIDSPEFRAWVAAERAEGRQVFWLKDVDKTQAAGDIFTFFFKWRADNGKFTPRQSEVIRDFLAKRKVAAPVRRQRVPYAGLRSWLKKEAGGDGINLLQFWAGLYWPSQIGMTEAEKLAQVNAFAPSYVERIYPGVPEENRLLTEIGVEVVIVSNGDQELARAVAPAMGINPLNVVGSHLKYGADGVSTGVNHSYEVFDEDWAVRPQPGKPLSFHYFLHANRERWGWTEANDSKFVIAGRDGDSASADGGMMILLPPAAIGNFMVDTPGEPDRLAKFYRLAAKYGWTRGQFITLTHEPSKLGRKP
jgi:hypothetical protein